MNIQISHNIKIKQLSKLYGAKDLQEEFKAFSNMIAAGYSGYEYGM